MTALAATGSGMSRTSRTMVMPGFFSEAGPAPRASKDERGAVMLIGLFMAMSLIGALWTVIGLGDALVYRDKVQEAADHVAFSSATVHARGMNFIAALNLVMLAIVAVYLVIDLIDKVLMAISIASEAACASIIFSEVGCPVAAFATPAYKAWDKWRDAYYNGMKPVLIGLSWTQTITAMVAPYGGLAAGAQVASNYKETGISLSTSMIPSFALTGGIANGSYDFKQVMGGTYGGDPTKPANAGASKFSAKGIDGRIGLPVSNQKMNQLCIYAADYTLEWMEGWLSKIPLIGLIFKIPGLSSIINGIIAGAIADLSCNEYVDGFWGRDGPKTNYQGNGSDWHQVFGLIFPGTFQEQSENKVAMSMGPKLGMGIPNVDPEGNYYVAQAEFYFDCNATWSDNACNGESGPKNIPRAMYSMRWMVRLRRVHYPSIGGMFIQWASGILTSSNILGPLKGKLASSDLYKKISGTTSDLAKKYGGSVGGWLAGKIFGNLANPKDGAIFKTGNGGGAFDTLVAGLGNLVPTITNPPATGMIH